LLDTTFGIYVAALGAPLRGVSRVDSDHLPTTPRLLRDEQPAEHAPALVQDRLVQARFGFDVAPWLVLGAFGRAGHLRNLQVFDHDDRVVFADLGRLLMQKILAAIGNSDVERGDAGLMLFPVAGERHFQCQLLLQTDAFLLIRCVKH